MTVVEAIAAVMADVRAVGKADFNDEGRFAFRGIDAIVNAVGPALRTHGVIVVPKVKDITFRTVELGERRHRAPHVSVLVRYRWFGPDGDHIDCTVAGEAFDAGDKAVAKAMSVAWRIALLQTLTLPTDEADPDATTYDRTPRTDADDAREDFAEWLTDEGIPLHAAIDRWAKQHPGEHLKDTEDGDGIRAMRTAWANERKTS